MRSTLLVFLTLVALPAAGGCSEGQAPPAWYRCVSDHDCVVVPSACGWDAVNAESQAEARRVYGDMARTMNCVEGSVGAAWNAVCDEGRCVLRPKSDAEGLPRDDKGSGPRAK